LAYNDIFRLRIYQRLHGAQVVNVLHFVQDDPTPGVGGAWLANDFLTNMSATLRARASNEVLFESIEVQSIVPFSGGSDVANFPANTLGTVGLGVTSATLAEVITIYTSRGGRRGRGRQYMAGAATRSSTGSSQGVWASTQTALTVNYATALAGRYIYTAPTVRFHLGVWSRTIAGPTPPWSTDAFVRATSLTVRTIMRTQRRRQVGVGR
jgi:hypothetical protein